MARLIDHLLNDYKWLPPNYVTTSPKARAHWENFRAKIVYPNLLSAEVFVVENVAKYFFEEPSMCKTWNVHTDFPNLAPQYPVMWFEHKAPKRLLERDGYERYLTRDVEELKACEKFPLVMRDAVGLAGDAGCLILSDENPNSEWEAKGRWTSLYVPFLTIGKDLVLSAFGAYYISVNPDGTVKNIGSGGFGVEGDFSDADGLGFHSVQLHCIPFMLSICFMHCKSQVNIVENSPDAPLQKKWRKTGHTKPLINWKTLEIDPLKRILEARAAQAKGGSDIHFALHQCRGHFKNYEEHGLFGKYKGTWFWHDQIRGSVAEGQIEKEYVVGEKELQEPTAQTQKKVRKIKPLKDVGGALGRMMKQ